MECPKCRTENPETKKYCRECGAELLLVCWNCGCELEPDDKFCGECGKKLGGDSAMSPAEPVTDAERKQVTALFSDLSGYTAMAARLDPEDVKEITSRIFDGVRTIVGKYDGFIEKFAGDGVLALFGVPKSHEDDPVRAIRAAREIHELVEAMNPTFEARVGAALSMHSGINTGLAVTADVDREKGTHGVTGDAINIAARLSELAAAREIFVGPETYRRAEGHFTFEALERATVKGKAEPISMYKVLSVKDQPITVHRQSGLRAELIGRKAELSQLHEAVERLKEGKASVIAVCGDAGTGKSRLVEEFKSSLDLSKIRWREGHSYPYSQNIPYFPLMDLMNRAWKIEEGDPPATVRQKIESGIERLLGPREDIAPYVGSLYALSYPEIEGVSPEFWKSRLFSGIQTIVAALIRYAPTIFCFEDVHWADPSSLELIRLLVRDPNCPALYLCVYRLPFTLFAAHQLSSLGDSYEEIRLHDLSQSDTMDMVQSLLKADGIPEELRKFIQKKVEGNPFYVEEAINSLVETGALARENGSWKVTRLLIEADIPPTVQGIISARLDRLETEMKRILQEASVIGRAFLHAILKRITALQESLDQSLHGLERLDLIKARSLGPELEYIFKHALTQEVVYNGLLKKERQEIHERIGLVMEKLFEERLPEFYETLGFHFKHGRSLSKAVDYLRKSGEKSLNRCAVKESHEYYRQAFEILTAYPDRTRDETQLLIDVVTDWALVFYYLGDFKGLGDLLHAHEDLAENLNDKARLGMFYAWVGWTLAWRENFRNGYEYLLKALKLGEEMDNQIVIGYSCTWLVWVCAEMGLFDQAKAYGERAAVIGKALGADQYVYFKALGGMGAAQWYHGNRTRPAEIGKELRAFGQKHSNSRSIVMGHFVMGFAAANDGDLATVIEWAHRASRDARDPFYGMFPKVLLGFAYARMGQTQQAREVCLEVIGFSEMFGTEWIGRMCHVSLGVVEILTGNMSQGLRMLEDDSKACLEADRKAFHARVEHVLGSVYLQIVLGEGDLSLSTALKNLGFLIKNVPFAAKKAELHFDRAIDVAKEIGAKGTLAQAYLDLGLLHKAKKRKEKARECLSKAVEYFELCEVETFLKQAREELESLA